MPPYFTRHIIAVPLVFPKRQMLDLLKDQNPILGSILKKYSPQPSIIPYYWPRVLIPPGLETNKEILAGATTEDKASSAIEEVDAGVLTYAHGTVVVAMAAITLITTLGGVIKIGIVIELGIITYLRQFTLLWIGWASHKQL